MVTMRPCLALGLVLAAAAVAAAQPLGTFRWQLQPYCNVIAVTVTPVGAIYRLEGTDDRCGAAEASSVIGTAFLNPDGTVGLGFNVVVAPGGVPQPVSAQLTLATLSGTWSDAQHAGQFVFSPGAGTGGSPRPVPAGGPAILAAFRMQSDGGFLAAGTFQSGTLPASGAGVRLMWAPAKAAIRAGRVDSTQWNDANIGTESAAFNRHTMAGGAYSVAANDGTRATGAASVALGTATWASGQHSLATGGHSQAEGAASFASGAAWASGVASFAAGGRSSGVIVTSANGADSLALGLFARARGDQAVAFGGSEAYLSRTFSTGNSFARDERSVALGSAVAYKQESIALGNADAGGVGGVAIGNATSVSEFLGASFYFGDRSRTSQLSVGSTPNQFIARAAGGVGFYTNSTTTSGVELASGGGSWAALSDANMKGHFAQVPGDQLLEKLARMPVREWNYLTQDASIRHLGPTAQDFRAAFGLGDFALRINTVDADGVALAAAQALDTRTREVGERHARLAAENRQLQSTHDALVHEQRALIERLERLLERGKR